MIRELIEFQPALVVGVLIAAYLGLLWFLTRNS